MATYKEIHGVKVQYRDSDAPAIIGDVWYNSSTGLLKMYSALGAWSTGGELNTARRSGSVGADEKDLATYAGGSSSHDETDQYNGSSWADVADLNTGRTATGGGGNKAAMRVVSGSTTARVAIVEEWDDSSWTEIADVNTARNEGVGFSGTVDSAILFGGETPSASALAETWNGTSWTETGDLNTARGRIGAATEGTVTATLGFGGAPNLNVSETWNGTSWTEGNNLNTGRSALSGCGIVTAAMAFGGQEPTFSVLSESYDGTSWSATAALGTAICNNAGIGTTTSAFSCGGTPTPPVYTNAVEEWSDPAYTIKTVTSS